MSYIETDGYDDECGACDGLGYVDRYISEYDIIEIKCLYCNGTGIEVGTEYTKY